MNKLGGFVGASISLALLALQAHAQSQTAAVGHPYVDYGMANMAGPHPLSAEAALEKLQAAGYTVSTRLIQIGSTWQIPPTAGGKGVQVDMVSGALTELPAK